MAIQVETSKRAVEDPKPSLLKRKSQLAKYKKELSARSLMLPFSIWLIVLYVFVGNACYNVAYDVASYLVTSMDQYECFHVDAIGKTIVPSFAQFSMVNALLFCLYPLTGWLADTVIGYDTTVNGSLWLCWIGMVLQCVNYAMQYSMGECSVPIAFKYALSLTTFLLISTGSTGLYTVLPAYGMAQLVDLPTATIRAFIHWYVMAIFLASLLGLGLISVKWSLLTCSCAVVFSSVALCLHGCFYGSKFEKVGTQAKNPYRTIFSVIKYVSTHGTMGKRSAFTYWEDNAPSRIDLSMIKYGGPFEENDVEDVKRFGRILWLILCTAGFYICYYATVYNATAFVSESSVINYQYGVLDNVIIVIIPALELIIIPCWPKLEYFLLSPLKGIGFSYVLNTLSVLAMFVIEIFYPGYSIEKSFLFNIPFFFSGLVHGFSFVYNFQFVCSQAPSNMRGMLLGIFWFFHAVFVNIGCFTFQLNRYLCAKWIFLLLLIISSLGLVVFILAVRWYKKTRYQAVYDPYNTISEIYSK